MNTWISLLPPIITIALAIKTRQVYLSLLAGISLGSILIDGNILTGVAYGAETIVNVFQSVSATKNILFILLIGAIINVMQKSGGISGFVEKLTTRSALVKGRKGAQLAAYGAGLMMFMEGIGSMMVAGLVGRPLHDKYGVSREKLAYIANCTGSPVAWLFPLGGAGAYLMGLLNSQVETGLIVGSPLTLLVQAIPFQFYTLLILLSVPLFILLNIEFGEMRQTNKQLTASQDRVTAEDKEMPAGNLANMLIPLVILVSAIFSIILITGDGNPAAGDAVSAIYWGAITSLFLTGVIFYFRRVTSSGTYIAWCMEGIQNMLPASVILVLAFAFGHLVGELGSAVHLANLLTDSLPSPLIPAAIFMSCSLISFATGSSGVAVGIVTSLAIPLAISSHCPLPLAVGAMVSGAVFGDQSSPISDSVIVASTAAGCKSVEHFQTQIPYTLGAAVISLLLFLCFGFYLQE